MTDNCDKNETKCNEEILGQGSAQEQVLPIGKLDSSLLEDLVFKHLKYRRSDVKARPGIGLDCATLDFGS